ncbi:ATPase family associated with various cellular activities (AAA) [Butyrivibrio hungatei DSM 14810]|uniref:ATPase family associated with various cellular activities (AAA) n=1 Tax=Butyrivibrio hungatei DSM 14810 TaxID=1121132 RepID=A0A1M7SEV9_9FIRM|nr:ATP-binding protein [Butyrivibrio hungatei]SHN56832.1 ATPase family associated with various cellular activities (AAA) [Butyrivibrio hungatei DSM 14810]
MKIISTGSRYDIYPDDLKSYDKLPADYYVVRFAERQGFFLEKYTEFSITDAKIYGVHLEKVDKVLATFKKFNRNLGVILSGDKGIGKSLFSRLLGKKSVENGTPVIIVDSYVEGIGSFLDGINQEVMVFFDEFDKTFSDSSDDDAQTSMLSLFDGVAQGKKLFVITCNEIKGLNDFLVNRPGRFHYHFRFEYPNEDDIREYLTDTINRDYVSEINNVVDFSKRVSLNYDCLRAIAFEINTGLGFSEAIKDLNIVNIDSEKFCISVVFADGSCILNNKKYMDSFSNENLSCQLYNLNGDYAGSISFIPKNIKYNSYTRELYLDNEDVEFSYYDYDLEDEENEKKEKEFKTRGIKKIMISRVNDDRLHYVV